MNTPCGLSAELLAVYQQVALCSKGKGNLKYSTFSVNTMTHISHKISYIFRLISSHNQADDSYNSAETCSRFCMINKQLRSDRTYSTSDYTASTVVIIRPTIRVKVKFEQHTKSGHVIDTPAAHSSITTEGFRGFPQSLQQDPVKYRDRFLLHPFQSSYHQMIQSTKYR